MNPAKVDLEDMAYVKKVLEKQADIGKAVQYLVTTGNLKTSSGLDLMQVSGYSVVAEKVRVRITSTHPSRHSLTPTLALTLAPAA